MDGEDVRGRLLALQIKGGVSWKLRVPAVNVLDTTARATLQEAAEGAADPDLEIP